MKKLTTTMMQETLNKYDGRLTVGLDLGDRSSFYCVLDGTGDVLLEQKVSTTPKALNEIFGAMPRSRIAVETGTHSPWVSRLLSELGHETIVAHARSVRLIGESRRKDDRLDAMTLARLVRIDPRLLCPVKHRSAEAQADLPVRSDARVYGTEQISGGRAAEADQGSGNSDCPDLHADARRSLSFPQEPGCSLLRGTSTWTAQLGTERAADVYQ
jgi:transposase